MYTYSESLAGKPASDPDVQRVNALQRMLARTLVTLSYSQDGRFRQDPARGIPPVPELAAATELEDVEEGSDRFYVLRNELTRAQNDVVWKLTQAKHQLEGRVL